MWIVLQWQIEVGDHSQVQLNNIFTYSLCHRVYHNVKNIDLFLFVVRDGISQNLKYLFWRLVVANILLYLLLFYCVRIEFADIRCITSKVVSIINDPVNIYSIEGGRGGWKVLYNRCPCVVIVSNSKMIVFRFSTGLVLQIPAYNFYRLMRQPVCGEFQAILLNMK